MSDKNAKESLGVPDGDGKKKDRKMTQAILED